MTVLMDLQVVQAHILMVITKLIIIKVVLAVLVVNCRRQLKTLMEGN